MRTQFHGIRVDGVRRIIVALIVIVTLLAVFRGVPLRSGDNTESWLYGR